MHWWKKHMVDETDNACGAHADMHIACLFVCLFVIYLQASCVINDDVMYVVYLVCLFVIHIYRYNDNARCSDGRLP